MSSSQRGRGRNTRGRSSGGGRNSPNSPNAGNDGTNEGNNGNNLLPNFSNASTMPANSNIQPPYPMNAPTMPANNFLANSPYPMNAPIMPTNSHQQLPPYMFYPPQCLWPSMSNSPSSGENQFHPLLMAPQNSPQQYIMQNNGSSGSLSNNQSNQSTPLSNQQSPPVANQQSPPVSNQQPAHVNNAEENVEEEESNVGAISKVYIIPAGFGFEPYTARDKVTSIMISKFEGAWPTWNSIPIEVRTLWFKEFKKYYYWDARHEEDIWKNFNHRGGARLRDFMSRARKSNKKPAWISPSNWDKLLAMWSEESYKNKCKKAQDNRLGVNSDPSFGIVKHTSGTKPAHERKRLLAAKLKREPTLEELYKDTHMVGGEWIDEKSKHTWEKFEAGKKEGQDALVVWVEQNLNKKGCIYGVGDLAPILKKKVETIPDSQSDPPDVTEKVTKMSEDTSKLQNMATCLLGAVKRHDGFLAYNIKAGKLQGTLLSKTPKVGQKLAPKQTQLASTSTANKENDNSNEIDKDEDNPNGKEDAP